MGLPVLAKGRCPALTKFVWRIDHRKFLVLCPFLMDGICLTRNMWEAIPSSGSHRTFVMGGKSLCRISFRVVRCFILRPLVSVVDLNRELKLETTKYLDRSETWSNRVAIRPSFSICLLHSTLLLGSSMAKLELRV